MNYRHIYHAGNFTDVVKHAVLTVILDYLRQKDSPFCFMDTHAGAGLYDLTSVEAVKTGEAQRGVQRILQAQQTPPPGLENYLKILESYRKEGSLPCYPGSPEFAWHSLRPQDTMILNECQPEVNAQLKQNFYGRPGVAIHQRDAYEFLPAILPPNSGRGLVLIDPSFEQVDENDKLKPLISKCLTRWAHGIYMIWYPITVQRSWNLAAVALQKDSQRFLIAGLTITQQTPNQSGLLGCQLLILNPTWKLAETLSPVLKYLWEIFNIDRGGEWFIK